MVRSVAALAAGAFFFASLSTINTVCLETYSLRSQQQTPGQIRPRRQMPKPTNLQVLPRDTAVPDLLALMRSYSAALGVECEFCHTIDSNTHKTDFASDANLDKGIARIMITMTKQINDRYI